MMGNSIFFSNAVFGFALAIIISEIMDLFRNDVWQSRKAPKICHFLVSNSHLGYFAPNHAASSAVSEQTLLPCHLDTWIPRTLYPVNIPSSYAPSDWPMSRFFRDIGLSMDDVRVCSMSVNQRLVTHICEPLAVFTTGLKTLVSY